MRGIQKGILIGVGIAFMSVCLGCQAQIERREIKDEYQPRAESIVHSPNAIKARGRLKVGMSIDRGGYSRLNSENFMEGFDAAFARTFAKELVEQEEALDIFYFNEGEKGAHLLESKADMIFGMSRFNDQNIEGMTFFPIMKADVSVVSLKSKKITNMEDLKERTTVVIINTPAHFVLNSRYPSWAIKEVVNYQQAYDLLIAGEVTAMAIDSPTALYWVKENQDYEVSIPSLDYEFELGIGIEENEVALIEWVRDTLIQLKAQGYYEQLYQEYLAPIDQDGLSVSTRFLEVEQK